MENQKDEKSLLDTKEYHKSLLDKEKNKFSNSLVFQIINYSDEKVIEKVKMFENINKKNISQITTKKIAYMSLFI